MTQSTQIGYEISELEFQKLTALVYKLSGITLAEHKKTLVVSRLSKRLRSLEMRSFTAYLTYVNGDSGKEELVQMLDMLSTNKTDFFREPVHFDFLTDQILAGRNPSEPLRIWSSACSSGEEPYSIAMTVHDAFSELPQSIACKILASDLSTRVLDKAAGGVYEMERVSDLKKPFLKRHFLKGSGKSDGSVKVKKHLSAMVNFKRINLMSERFQIKADLDVIFCRNVMIYFDRPTQQTLIGKFYQYLKPGGYLFIGHSESLNWIEHPFDTVAPTIYRRGDL